MNDPAGSDLEFAGVPLAQFAAVTAALAEGFPLRAVLGIEGLDARRWAEADRGWTERLDQDATLLSRYQTELAAAHERLHAREEPAPEDAKAAPLRAGKARLVRSRTGLGMPAFAGDEPARPSAISAPVAVPVAPPPVAAPPPPVVAPPVFVPAAVPSIYGNDDEESTRTAFQVSADVLPFRTTADLEASEPVAPRRPEPAPARRSSDDEGTQAAFEVPAHFFPFHAKPAAPASPPPGPPASPPAVPKVWDDDEQEEAGTIATVQPAVRALPFHGAPSREFQQALERPGAAPGAGSDGSTVALRGLESLRALKVPDGPPTPWVPGPQPSAKPAGKPAAPPPPPAPRAARPTGQMAASAAGQGAPPMSLERHASLCLEIALDPGRAAEALARYQVSAADKARADEYYRLRIASDPDVGAQWSQAYAAYHAWFTSRSRT